MGGGYICKIKRRTQQLIIPYLIWTVIAVLITTKGLFIGQLFHNFLYPSGGYWFLWVLWVVTILMYLILNVSVRSHIKDEWLTVFIAIVLLGSEAILNTKVLALHLISFYFVFYTFGYYYKKYESQMPSSRPYKIIIGFCVWYALASFWNMEKVPFFLKDVPLVPSSIMNLLYRFVTAIVGIWVLINAGNIYLNSSSKLNSIFAYLGKISIGIYVCHMIIGPYINKIFSVYTSVSVTTNILLSFVITASLSIIIIGIIDKNKYTSKYLLGKI